MSVMMVPAQEQAAASLRKEEALRLLELQREMMEVRVMVPDLEAAGSEIDVTALLASH